MFDKFTIAITKAAGSKVGFLAAIAIVVGWAATGPFFKFSPGWNLAINTITTVITFLMVFVIQSTQNKDTAALHLKLDELIKVNTDARNELRGAESKSAKEIEKLKEDGH